MLRFTEISPASGGSPVGRSTLTLRPSMAIKSTEVSLECGKSRTCCARPRRLSTGQHDGFKQSPHTFSRGNLSRSRTSVCNPARAQHAAQVDPAGPPPTITTSKICIPCLISFVMSSEVETSLISRDQIQRFLDFARNDKGSLALNDGWRAIQYESKLA